MKLQQLHEMGAAAVCPKCGQGPMSKTHYWYKGGWQCRTAATTPPAPQAVPAAGNMPAQTVIAQSRVAPPAPKTPAPSLGGAPQGNALPRAAAQGMPHATQRKMIERFVTKLGVKQFTVNGDLSVDVDGDVSVTTEAYTRIPCKFGKVSGNFVWAGGKLRSLENAPDEVGGEFDVHANQITSLQGFPSTVGGDVSLSGNQLTTWEGLPSTINGDLYVHGNPASDMVEHLPAEIKGSLTIGSSQPWSLRGIHKKTKIDGEIQLLGNVAEGGLGLMMLKGVTFIDASSLTDKGAEKAFEIIDKACENKDDVLDTQERLIDAGLAKFAKL